MLRHTPYQVGVDATICFPFDLQCRVGGREGLTYYLKRGGCTPQKAVPHPLHAALRRALGPLKDALAGLYGEFVSADMIQIGITNVVASVLPFAQNNPDATAILLVTVTAPDEVAQVVVSAIAVGTTYRDYKDLSTDSAITAILVPFGLSDPSGITITVDGVPL